MAYFSNGTEGEPFDEECSQCALFEEPCPIAYVQVNWNYEACNNEVATAILGFLVKQGTPEEGWPFKGCAMKPFIDKLTGA